MRKNEGTIENSGEMTEKATWLRVAVAVVVAAAAANGARKRQLLSPLLLGPL